MKAELFPNDRFVFHVTRHTAATRMANNVQLPTILVQKMARPRKPRSRRRNTRDVARTTRCKPSRHVCSRGGADEADNSQHQAQGEILAHGKAVLGRFHHHLSAQDQPAAAGIRRSHMLGGRWPQACPRRSQHPVPDDPRPVGPQPGAHNPQNTLEYHALSAFRRGFFYQQNQWLLIVAPYGYERPQIVPLVAHGNCDEENMNMMKYTSVDSYNDDLAECLHQALTGGEPMETSDAKGHDE